MQNTPPIARRFSTWAGRMLKNERIEANCPLGGGLYMKQQLSMRCSPAAKRSTHTFFFRIQPTAQRAVIIKVLVCSVDRNEKLSVNTWECSLMVEQVRNRSVASTDVCKFARKIKRSCGFNSCHSRNKKQPISHFTRYTQT